MGSTPGRFRSLKVAFDGRRVKVPGDEDRSSQSRKEMCLDPLRDLEGHGEFRTERVTLERGP